MSKIGFVDFKVCKEVISKENVFAMAEVVAFAEARYLIGFMGYKMQKVFNNFCIDIRCKNNKGYVLSDSYELVQECALCLCEHCGEYLSNVVGYSKKGKKDNRSDNVPKENDEDCKP